MDLKADDAPAGQAAAVGAAQPPQPPGAPSKEERLDFLKQAIAFTEWTIRSFDTKAQISIAAFVLAMNPLWSMLTSACPRAGSSLAVVALLALFVATILLFGYVIWPVTLTQSHLTGGWRTKGLFYVGDPNQLTASLYARHLNSLAIEEELAAETLKLAYIREMKSRRFKNALKSVVVFYVWVLVTFLLLRNCSAG
jgi:predicted PurR-regulated permease PerM